MMENDDQDMGFKSFHFFRANARDSRILLGWYTPLQSMRLQTKSILRWLAVSSIFVLGAITIAIAMWAHQQIISVRYVQAPKLVSRIAGMLQCGGTALSTSHLRYYQANVGAVSGNDLTIIYRTDSGRVTVNPACSIVTGGQFLFAIDTAELPSDRMRFQKPVVAKKMSVIEWVLK
jgi:hypothetical protein